MPYAELHARSAYNFLRGASRAKDMAHAFADAGIGAAACLDRNGVYGAPEFTFAAEQAGVAAIVGAELTLEPVEDCEVGADGGFGHLPVLVESRGGYRNLCRLLTRAQLRWRKGGDRGPSPQLSLDELAGCVGGLVALTGDDEGPLAAGWRAGGHAGMGRALEALLGVFTKDRLYVEIQRHQVRGERHYNRALVELARSRGLELVATNSPCYTAAAGRRVLDVFTCLRHHTTADAAGRLLERNSERRIKGEAEMRALFADLPDAVDAAGRLAERLSFRLRDLGYAFPKFPVPAGENHDSYLRKLTLFGADQRYGALSRRVRRQLDHELGIIGRLGFAGYFLIVWDIVNFCRERGIMAQGRGSAANSAVCYALGITAVDPVGGNLLFERFLSEGRRSWPDIDIDLPSGGLRESVIQEVYRRYGKHGAAMTANVITYRGRSAMREIGKVLGLPVDTVERFNALFSRGDFPHTLEIADQLKRAGIDLANPRHRAAVEVYRDVLGLPRHLGQHSGGMIVCNDALNEVVPLENASMEGRVVAQWDKDACEDLGIIKIDLLGLGMMAVLQDCVQLTHERGRGVDIAHLPKDDTATYDLLCRAETVGVFQVESRAQMATLPRMKPRRFYDLAVEVAIIRPGPIAGDLANPYLNRRNGLEPVEYIDQRLKPVLERTLGVPLFQEQVLKMAMVMADYDANESEELRRALGFTRDDERIGRAKKRLREKLEARGVAPETVDRMVDTISSFALYGFPESHAISFALIAYASAWLKVHRPEEFYCALLNNQPMGFYAPATLVQDGRRRDLRFLPPDVTCSSWECTIEDPAAQDPGEMEGLRCAKPAPCPSAAPPRAPHSGAPPMERELERKMEGLRCAKPAAPAQDPPCAAVRLGLKLVHGVPAKAVEAMLEERSRAPFRSLVDFRLRCAFDRDELRALARAGALNGLAGSRRRALWEVEQVLEPDLFAAAEDAADYGALPLTEMTLWERICADFETTSVTTGDHPMAQLRARLPDTVVPAGELGRLRNGRRVTVAGAVICRQRPGTAKGVVFVSLEDETGIANCILWPALFEKIRLTVSTEPYLRVTGKLQKSQGTIHIIASVVKPLELDDAPAGASHDFC